MQSLDLMNARFPESIVSKTYAEGIARYVRSVDAIMAFFDPFGPVPTGCGRSSSSGLDPGVRAFWGLSENAKSFDLYVNGSTLEVTESPDDPSDDVDDRYSAVGKATFATQDESVVPLGGIYLPAEQRIFPLPQPVPPTPSLPPIELPHGNRTTRLLSGTYVATNGVRRTLELDMRGDEPRITGTWDGRLVGGLYCGMHGPYGTERTGAEPLATISSLATKHRASQPFGDGRSFALRLMKRLLAK